MDASVFQTLQGLNENSLQKAQTYSDWGGGSEYKFNSGGKDYWYAPQSFQAGNGWLGSNAGVGGGTQVTMPWQFDQFHGKQNAFGGWESDPIGKINNKGYLYDHDPNANATAGVNKTGGYGTNFMDDIARPLMVGVGGPLAGYGITQALGGVGATGAGAGASAGGAGLPESYWSATAGGAGAASDAPGVAAGTMGAGGGAGTGGAIGTGSLLPEGSQFGTGLGLTGGGGTGLSATGGGLGLSAPGVGTAGAGAGGMGSWLGQLGASMLPNSPAGWGRAGLGLVDFFQRMNQQKQLKDIANQSARMGNALDQPQRGPYQSLLSQYYNGGQDITQQPMVKAELDYMNRQATAALAKQGMTGSGNAPAVYQDYAREGLNRTALPYLNTLQGIAGFNQGPGYSGNLYGQYAAASAGAPILGLEELVRAMQQQPNNPSVDASVRQQKANMGQGGVFNTTFDRQG